VVIPEAFNSQIAELARFRYWSTLPDQPVGLAEMVERALLVTATPPPPNPNPGPATGCLW
jgi:hypothetical protein